MIHFVWHFADRVKFKKKRKKVSIQGIEMIHFLPRPDIQSLTLNVLNSYCLVLKGHGGAYLQSQHSRDCGRRS
jgi:hypothetical protein